MDVEDDEGGLPRARRCFGLGALGILLVAASVGCWSWCGRLFHTVKFYEPKFQAYGHQWSTMSFY